MNFDEWLQEYWANNSGPSAEYFVAAIKNSPTLTSQWLQKYYDQCGQTHVPVTKKPMRYINKENVRV